MRVLPLVCLLGACAAPPVDDWVSIDHGVYGALRTYNDTGGGGVDALDNTQVFVKDGAMVQTLATATSDGDGYYEIALAAGDYTICMTWNTCAAFSIDASMRVHLDFEAGPGGGRWIPVAPTNQGSAAAAGPSSARERLSSPLAR